MGIHVTNDMALKCKYVNSLEVVFFLSYGMCVHNHFHFLSINVLCLAYLAAAYWS